jgi:hypothetical protein
VLIVGIIVAVMVVLLTVGLLTRRVSHDDVHSVEGYHRSLHTLEEINAHPSVSSGVAADAGHRASAGTGAGAGAGAKAAYPESAVRLAGTSTVRVTDAPPASVPPVPLPSVAGADPDLPVTFRDDAHWPRPVGGLVGGVGVAGVAGPVPPPPPPAAVPVSARAARRGDKAMSSINHRPRRLAGPAVAVACVAVLIVVLLVTGSHTVAPPHRHAPASTTGHGRSGTHTGSGSAPPHGAKSTSTPSSTPSTTPITQPPTVSQPQASSASAATYQVANADFTVALSATSGPCWVDATNATTGAPYFVGTLTLGQQHSFAATGPVTLVVGAPNVLAASVDGTPVQLPSGFTTPFTMQFVPMVSPAT